ncbi:MAG: TonB-dependent receptor [Bacteroidetes bacterium]|nr:TonB-dependent receptor [Bacteroidota bacterium]MBS1591797.1 TonB-dependent receptor [Bacteroidota bacterium]
MKSILSVLIPALLIVGKSFSQEKNTAFRVLGNVSFNQKPVESATVALLKAKDSSVVKISATLKDGNFEILTNQSGNFLISIQALSFNKYYSKTFYLSDNQGSVKLENIALTQAVKNLETVTVSSKKPLIEQKIDKTILNVEASVTNVGATALEVLEKAPGVTVDKDGNISLKGKAGVQIFIDGKPAYVSGQDLTNLLTNMQSSQLDQIEIMTNPPAKYDAAGNAGIINIKTKKTKAFGFNGSVGVNYSQGFYGRGGENVNLNYRENKFNVFGSLSHNYRKNYQNLYVDRKFIDATSKNVLSIFNQVNHLFNQGEAYRAKAGADWFVSPKTTIGVVVNASSNPNTFTSNGVINISDPNAVLQSKTLAAASNPDNPKDFSTNLNFRRVLGKKGQEITADLDYINYNSTASQNLNNKYYDSYGNPTFKPDTLLGSLPQTINIYSAKIDYTMPLKNEVKFEAGIKTSYVKTDANASYDSVINGNLVHDYNRSNHFIYEENVNAAYVNFSKPFSKKITAQLGLRLEHTVSKGNQITTNIQFNKNYVQLFPTAYVQYTLNDKNTFVLNYGRRIRRPDYESLNPFIEFIDKYTYQQGNPNLQPQFSHNIELSHTYKNFLTTTLNYTNTTDIIQQVLEQNTATNQTYVKQANIAKQHQFGIAINAATQFTKWWSSNFYVNVYNNLFSGIINNTYEEIGATSAVFNISEQLKFNKGWSAEVSGFYRTKAVESVFTINPFGQMSVGVSKQLLKNKATIRLAVSDILYTQKVSGYNKLGNIDASFKQDRDSRQVSLAFTYRFNKTKGKVANVQKRKTGGADDEESRINKSN